MEDKLFFGIKIPNHRVTANNYLEWLNKINFFKPQNLMTSKLTKHKTIKYNEELLLKGIHSEVNQSDNFSILLDGEDGSFNLMKGHYCCTLNFTISKKQFTKMQEGSLLDMINDLFVSNEGIVGFACSNDDEHWQNNKSIDEYYSKGRSLDNIRLIQDTVIKSRQIIDLNYFPGRTHHVKGLRFGSCWTMWFGEKFYEYVPKNILSGFQECFENKKIGNTSLRIMLYPNVWEYDKPENREIQWKFRRQVGIDEAAQICRNGGEYIIPNPSIEIFTKGDFKHGGNRLVKYYYDLDGNVVVKSEASECRSYEFNEQSELIWSEIEIL